MVDDDLDAADAGRAGRGAATRSSPARSRCATGRSSRPRTPRGCGSASSPRRTSASLDLRRGELRVLGKGRKERIGLLGRPAREALEAYLDDGRPVPRRDARPRRLEEPPTAVFLNHHGEPLGVRGLRGRLDRLRRARGPARGRQPAHAAPQLRDPPARGRRGPAGRAGAARPREPRDDAGLHARVAGPPARGLPRRASPGAGDVREDADDDHRRVEPPDDVPAATTTARPGPGRATTATRALARAGIIVTVAFLLSRVLGYVRYVVDRGGRPGRRAARRVLRRVPDPGLPVPARRRRGAVVGADPGHRRAVRDRRGGAGVAGRVDRHDADARALVVLAGVVLLFAPGSSPIITPGFDADELALTTELTRIMVLSPLFLAAGAVATSVAQRARPVRRGGARAARLQPRDHRRARCCSCRRSASTGSPSASCVGAAGHLLVQVPTLRRIGGPDPAAGRPGRPAGAARARADGAARARPRARPRSCSSS